jgi:hypothetical protein
MNSIKLACAAALLTAVAAAPASAGHKYRHHHHSVRDANWMYNHNYGPPVWPGETFATYDGPLSARCKQGAAAYRGQDGRRHPCY